MLSKAKGQVLRIAAALHVLTGDSESSQGDITIADVSATISKEAILAAQNFVQTCCQHAAYVAGRGEIDDEIGLLLTGKYAIQIDPSPTAYIHKIFSFSDEVLPSSPNKALATYCLQLPGKKLHLSALLAAKKVSWSWQ